MHAQRGQVLPVYALGIGLLLMMATFALNYANVLRWQVRAQNAADAAAASIVALQSQQFNDMQMALYASSVEEFRVRRLLNGMILASHNQGGCYDPGQGSLTVQPACDQVYQALRPAYLRAVARYTKDVELVNEITVNLDFGQFKNDASALLARLSSCSGAGSGDCAFAYKVVDLSPRQGLSDVEMDALGILKPSFNLHTGPAKLNDELFAPAQVEVAVCAQVPPIFPPVLGFSLPVFHAMGRAAATGVMVSQDWMQPGTLQNPWSGKPFQPAEFYAQPTPDDSGYDWYAVNFGGNRTQAYAAYNTFRAGLFVDELSAQLGWWNSVPIRPYAGQRSSEELGCSS